MYRIGFDVGGTSIKVGAVDNNMQIAAGRSIAFPKGETYEEVVSLMAKVVNELAWEMKLASKDFKSIGIATAGSIDAKNGIIINAHNLGFHNVPRKF